MVRRRLLARHGFWWGKKLFGSHKKRFSFWKQIKTKNPVPRSGTGFFVQEEEAHILGLSPERGRPTWGIIDGVSSPG